LFGQVEDGLCRVADVLAFERVVEVNRWLQMLQWADK